MHMQRQASNSTQNKCEIIMEDFSKLDEIDTFKDFIRVDNAEMTLLGAPVLKGSAQDAAIKHQIDDLSRAIERLTLYRSTTLW